ncbi:hypothetical protein GC170_19975 [bacterium]|nr:hypothetical protein [bacterium]
MSIRKLFRICKLQNERPKAGVALRWATTESLESRVLMTLGLDYAMADRFAPNWADPKAVTLPNTAEYARPAAFDVTLKITGEADPEAEYVWKLTPESGNAEPVETRGESPKVSLQAGVWKAEVTELRDGQVIDTGTGDVTVKDILVVAIGDSYGSGEGNPELSQRFDLHWSYRHMTAAQLASADLNGVSSSRFPWAWQVNTTAPALWARSGDPTQTQQSRLAHRSVLAYSAQYAMALEKADPHTSVTYVSVAQSGATIPTLMNQPNVAAEDGSTPLPPQLPELAKIIGDRPIDTLVVSIGGNDAGFADIVKKMALSNFFMPDLLPKAAAAAGLTSANADAIAAKVLAKLQSRPPLGMQWVLDTYQANTANLAANYGRLDEAIRKNFTVNQVAITEYPDVSRVKVRGIDGNPVNWWGPVVFDLLPGVAVNSTQAMVATKLIAEPLNATIAQAAASNGWVYVGGINDAFAGRGYSAPRADRWMRTARESLIQQNQPEGISGTLYPLNTKGTVHPTAAGHTAMAEKLAEALGKPKVADTLAATNPAIRTPALPITVAYAHAVHDTDANDHLAELVARLARGPRPRRVLRSPGQVWT